MSVTRVREILLLAGLAGIPVHSAFAQCPDGTPPPCRGAAPGAAPRRVAPPIDDHTWIVVPFENVARASDIDWLRDASVNLLYLDMSKWRDIRVIDDERVADLIREVPEARGGAQLTLQTGIAVAKRAGAGRLVMGDLLKVGSKTQMVGKVFDVKTGQRVRTVRQEASNADSIMSAFGQLARGVLNVGSETGSAAGIGTTSVGAYQAYISGIGYLNNWLLDSARTQFDRALALDSTFALAHYKLALVYGWDSPAAPEGPRHAQLASRYGTSLPPRERNLVTGYAAFSAHKYADACDIFGRMVRADSSDVEAWYNVGECSYHDVAVVPVGGDSAKAVFRGNWNTMLRAFRKTLELDPTYHLAFQHIQDALLTSTRTGCFLKPESTQCPGSDVVWQAFVLRDGDSLLMVPVNLTRDPQGFAAQGLRFAREHARARNLQEARRAVEGWLQAGPNEVRPKSALARILLRQGDIAGARAVMAQIGATAVGGRVESSNYKVDRVEAAIKVDSFAEASRVADSLRTALGNVDGASTAVQVIWAILGHSDALDAVSKKAIQGPVWVVRFFNLQARSMLGFVSDSIYPAEAEFAKNVLASQGMARAAQLVAPTLVWTDPRLRGNRWPATDTTSSDPRLRLFSYLATGDTARFKKALAHFDSIATDIQDGPDNGFALSGAYAHLVVADTAGALRLLRSFRDQTWARTPLLDQLGSGFNFAGMLWPRTFILLGDLSAATGQRADALAAYRRALRFWATPDSDLAAEVLRVKAAVEALER